MQRADLSDPGNPDDPQDGARLKAILLVCAALAFAAAPLMTRPFTGFAPDQFPNPTPPLPLQPAGYAFAIWGVIYLWLIISAIYGLIKRDVDPGWDATRWPLFLSLALGASWIGVALLNPLIATLLIFVMLGGALIAMARAPLTDIWLCAAPIGLYAGWLTAASFVAAATTLAGWTGISAGAANWIGLIAIGVLGLTILRLRPPVTYAVALDWALVGVAVSVFSHTPLNLPFAFGICAAFSAIGFGFIRGLRKG
ncbi:hypothetical protein E2K80_01435 [Rhodophyticola sp. CCM32]|uniref:hypothetical protein n=1 Tax=Rhodophyticola sp. CCM32 TaxID=2916397 RepID=UPI00107F2F64|nr:hypothetical protein [Rhodophyticola sp. CCM32]QBX99550.1 hypothetical protein E2K80_01435 [Rhodophyticola sp. CCM32]